MNRIDEIFKKIGYALLSLEASTESLESAKSEVVKAEHIIRLESLLGYIYKTAIDSLESSIESLVEDGLPAEYVQDQNKSLEAYKAAWKQQYSS